MAERKRIEERMKTSAQREDDRIKKLTDLGREEEILRAFKEVYETNAGRFVIEYMLWITSPLGNPHDKNTSNMSFMLGEQNIGRKLVRKLIEAGCDVNVAKLSNNVISDKLGHIAQEIKKLNSEGKKI